MRIAYFDCFSGASGNMILGAFLDAGLDVVYLKKQLRKLPLSGYSLNIRKVKKSGLAATQFDVSLTEKGRQTKSLNDIRRIISKSALSAKIKNLSCEIFQELADAECGAHGCKMKQARFHEIGDTDSIIDIVGAAIALDYLKIDKIYASAINTGSGTINTAHGRFPIPAPATSILLKGVPIYCDGKGHELATPTGVAILKTICEKFGQMPLMETQQIGTGAGNFDTGDRPNVLRVFIGDAADETAGGSYNKDTVVVVQANIDDMNSVGTECILERIFKAGALDVYFAPIYMKKTRMGILLSAITEKKNLDAVLKAIFRETTTLGVRTYEVTRYKLDRSVETVRSKYGSVRIKMAGLDNQIVSVSPEYEDCKRLSGKKAVPFRIVYGEAVRSGWDAARKKT